MGLKLTCQGRWVARDRLIRFAERGVIGSQCPGNSLLVRVFLLELTNSLTAHFQIATKITNHYHPPKSTKSFPVGTILTRRKEENWNRIKIEVGTSVTVKVGEINEKIREGKSRSMRKKMFGLYYLAHIDFVLVLSHFWWLVLVLSMVYRWWTPVKVSAEIPYTYWQFCSTYLYLHPLVDTWWRLGQSWTQNFPWIWGQG